MLDKVLESLGRIRANPFSYEYDLQKAVATRFSADGIEYVPEYSLGKGDRIDFFVSGIGIEVKKGVPNATKVLLQLERYARHQEIEQLVLVTERNMGKVPESICGKPCTHVMLSHNWGVAI